MALCHDPTKRAHADLTRSLFLLFSLSTAPFSLSLSLTLCLALCFCFRFVSFSLHSFSLNISNGNCIRNIYICSCVQFFFYHFNWHVFVIVIIRRTTCCRMHMHIKTYKLLCRASCVEWLSLQLLVKCSSTFATTMTSTSTSTIKRLYQRPFLPEIVPRTKTKIGDFIQIECNTFSCRCLLFQFVEFEYLIDYINNLSVSITIEVMKQFTFIDLSLNCNCQRRRALN